jgi:sugar lactone lactonase YvrE
LRRVARIGDSHPNLRLNDGAAMPDGSFIVGTMHVFREAGEAPLGGLYRLNVDGKLHRLDTGLGVVNGPAMHPHGTRFSVCDSEARKIYSYAVGADGLLSSRFMFVDTSAFGSAPDGCCFDRDGGLWTALVHAGAIARFDAQGKLTNRIDLPLRHPASLCFGGAQLQDIYVTSISDSGRLKAGGPLDGALLRIRGSGFLGAPRPFCRMTC